MFIEKMYTSNCYRDFGLPHKKHQDSVLWGKWNISYQNITKKEPDGCTLCTLSTPSLLPNTIRFIGSTYIHKKCAHLLTLSQIHNLSAGGLTSLDSSVYSRVHMYYTEKNEYDKINIKVNMIMKSIFSKEKQYTFILILSIYKKYLSKLRNSLIIFVESNWTRLKTEGFL